MVQAKFSLEESQIQLISQHKRWGFKDKSTLVRRAINNMALVLEQEQFNSIDDLLTIVREETAGIKA